MFLSNTTPVSTDEFRFRVRVSLHWLVSKPMFDGFIMFVIMLSSIALAAEDPVTENAPRNKLLGSFDYWFTSIFFVECFIKVTRKKCKYGRSSRRRSICLYAKPRAVPPMGP